MKEERLRTLLQAVKQGHVDIETGMERLKNLHYEEMEYACLDHHRRFRDILPEVVYGPGKTEEQLVSIIQRLASAGGPLLVTRVHEEKARGVLKQLSVSEATMGMEYSRKARALYLEADAGRQHENRGRGYVLVVTAGTADIPVAEEACLTLRLAGHEYKCIYDAGVAGVHRLLSKIRILAGASVIIAVAGMDGALPSVIGGLVAVPVIAVPADTGYGANFSGLAPLLTMLNSCATGVAVVNIDNGFGAAAVAAMIDRNGRESACQ